MGAKYTTQATSGYNSSPPADDGTQAAANLITWAGIKSKFTDVLKTFGEAINTACVSAFDYSVRQISASDSTVASDHMRCVEIAPTVTTAVTVSLGDAVSMTTVYRVFVKNSSAINQTVGRVTVGDTIDGAAANVTLAPGEGRIFQTNATPNGYLTVSKFGPFVDTNPIAVGSADGTKKVRVEADGVAAATTRVWTAQDKDITVLGQEDVATQANQETATSTTTFVSPGRQQFHPSAPKGWIKCNAAGAIQTSYNVSSIADDATGQVTISWNVDFSSADYCVVCTIQKSGAAQFPRIDAVAAGTTTVVNVNTSFANADPDNYHVVALGDQ